MKSICLFFILLILPFCSFCQHPVTMRNLWEEPRVHVLFQGYSISFRTKDVDKALAMLYETGDTTYGDHSGLDTAKNYFVELQQGERLSYRNSLQDVLQNAVGAFLISAGHAYIQNHRHKVVHEVIMDIRPLMTGTDEVAIYFFDPKNNKLLFCGKMAADMYKKDLGLD